MENGKILIGTEKIDLSLTLMDSAQCFHWVERDGRFGAVLDGRPVWLWQEDGALFAAGDTDPTSLRRYLDLERDYSVLTREYAAYPEACRAVEAFPGLRVLRQPVWETVVSFILSANNNVGRIRKLVEAICLRYGRRFDTEYGELYGFPGAEVLRGIDPAELRTLGVGYRDRYLVESAAMIDDGLLPECPEELGYEETHSLLTKLPGVGDKVADCIQLFGCGQTEAFPVDVWVARLSRTVFHREDANRSRLGREMRELLGQDAGLLQQFLFHAARTGKLDL